MPNHVSTILKAPVEVIEALIHTPIEEEEAANRQKFDERLARLKAEGGRVFPWDEDYKPLPERWVDFGLVVPQPENMEEDGCAMEPTDAEGRHPDGTVCWYRWNTQHWGTKWNAYDADFTQVSDGVLRFDTAWSHPVPIIRALSAKFPEAAIEVTYADEDLGSNCGSYEIRGGFVSEEYVPAGIEALDFASEIKYGKPYEDMLEEWEEDEELVEYRRRKAEEIDDDEEVALVNGVSEVVVKEE